MEWGHDILVSLMFSYCELLTCTEVMIEQIIESFGCACLVILQLDGWLIRSGAPDYGDGLERYCSHTSGNPWLLLSVLNADFVKGTAIMSYSWGALGILRSFMFACSSVF